MKRYNITVNGRAYDVVVEEADGSSAPVAAPAPQAAPAAAPTPAPVEEATAPSAKGAIKVESPMPGTIMDVKVAVGDTVKDGQVLVILEAMKMENDIVSPGDGVVASINVKQGDSVSANDLLISIN